MFVTSLCSVSVFVFAPSIPAPSSPTLPYSFTFILCHAIPDHESCSLGGWFCVDVEYLLSAFTPFETESCVPNDLRSAELRYVSCFGYFETSRTCWIMCLFARRWFSWVLSEPTSVLYLPAKVSRAIHVQISLDELSTHGAFELAN